METASRAQFFYLSEVDGRKIDNALFASRKANSGRGFSMIAVPFGRDVPARASTFLLEARVTYGAPIQEMMNSGTIYTAQRTVTFTPEANKTYLVKGILSEQRREVWIEEDGTGKRID